MEFEQTGSLVIIISPLFIQDTSDKPDLARSEL